MGVSLFISALNVYYRDFMYALPFVIQVWMYASPVVYSGDLIPKLVKPFYAINPMVGIIDGFRWALLGTGEFPAAVAGDFADDRHRPVRRGRTGLSARRAEFRGRDLMSDIAIRAENLSKSYQITHSSRSQRLQNAARGVVGLLKRPFNRGRDGSES